MKAIGLIGGMSWESTAIYYQQINQAVREKMGGLHSAEIVMHSCDFAEIVSLQQQGDWDAMAGKLAAAAQSLERAGAGCLAICTNTMHKVAAEVQAAVNIPLIDIRDVIGEAIEADGLHTIGLLGTRYTMEQEFFRAHLAREWGLKVLTPQEEMYGVVHEIIFGELCQGIVSPANRVRMTEIISEMAKRGAQGIILGCTELMLLLSQDDSPLPLYDTTTLHARSLVSYAMGEDAHILPASHAVLAAV
ncbi:MAG: aspartate/glutamate racemase family protein [Capsulimonas sp.]|uniref:aspartate/glutamate racemase family protein n=1 Tax=Capsulimonas sp. TaxID=2494211 RepID=UPI0032651998